MANETLYAKKDNKVYKVDETSKGDYLAKGYNIINAEGEVVEASPVATVAYAKYKELEEENARLKAALAELEAEQKEPEEAEKKGKK